MPNIAIGEIPTYTDDLGRTINSLSFKIRRDMLPFSGFAAAANNVCGAGGGLFTPRGIKIDFADGSSIRFPVASPGEIPGRIAALMALPGAACAHLIGEKWAYVPAGILGVTAADPVYTLPDGVTDIETGAADYVSDLIGGTRIRYKVEQNPNALSSVLLACMSNRITGTVPCTASAGIQPRALTALARNDGTNGILARKTKPESVGADVIDCASNLYGVAFCVKYTGESARNAHLLIP